MSTPDPSENVPAPSTKVDPAETARQSNNEAESAGQAVFNPFGDVGVVVRAQPQPAEIHTEGDLAFPFAATLMLVVWMVWFLKKLR